MDYSNIIEWVVMGVILLVALAITVFNAIKSIKARKTAGETINFDVIFAEITNAALGFISDAEKAYEQIKGNSDIKTGILKKDNVLSKIREICEDKGMTYDKNYWSEFIDIAVNLINVKKSNPTEVQTSGQTPVTTNLK